MVINFTDDARFKRHDMFYVKVIMKVLADLRQLNIKNQNTKYKNGYFNIRVSYFRFNS